MATIEKRLRNDTPQIGIPIYHQIHAHSTGNSNSTVQNEVDNQLNNRPVAFATHTVGNGRIIQTAPTNRGAYDVGGGWNCETYAAVELIESHKTKAEFDSDYKLYVDLLRQLADEAKLPKTLDTSDLSGIKTHYHCTYNQPNNGSDHIDPYPYLQKWNISKAQFKEDVENGLGTQPAEQEQKTNKTKKGVVTMFAIYWIPNAKNPKVEDAFYFNGVSYEYIENADSIKVLKEVYKKNNGTDIPEFHWTNGAPWWIRLQQPVVNLQELADTVAKIAKKVGV